MKITLLAGMSLLEKQLEKILLIQDINPVLFYICKIMLFDIIYLLGYYVLDPSMLFYLIFTAFYDWLELIVIILTFILKKLIKLNKAIIFYQTQKVLLFNLKMRILRTKYHLKCLYWQFYKIHLNLRVITVKKIAKISL